jgi:hypothetical protein
MAYNVWGGDYVRNPKEIECCLPPFQSSKQTLSSLHGGLFHLSMCQHFLIYMNLVAATSFVCYQFCFMLPRLRCVLTTGKISVGGARDHVVFLGLIPRPPFSQLGIVKYFLLSYLSSYMMFPRCCVLWVLDFSKTFCCTQKTPHQLGRRRWHSCP